MTNEPDQDEGQPKTELEALLKIERHLDSIRSMMVFFVFVTVFAIAIQVFMALLY